MEAYPFSAEQLYDEIFYQSADFILLDVRNNEEFERFAIEGPYLKRLLNVPYFEFLEFEEESVQKVPVNNKIKIVCAKEGSAKYVADILLNNGFDDVGYLTGGIGTWADLLKPVIIEKNDRFTLYQFIRPGKASCSYGLVCGQACYIFDPARMVDDYLNFVTENNVKLTGIFETHLQADYISGSQQLSKDSGAEIIANEADFKIATFNYHKVVDGEVFKPDRDKVEVKAVFTPGHTPGSTSYLIDNRFLISGDAVFIKSIGRPDLGGKVEEWSTFLFDTIQNTLKMMDNQIEILPGHYMDWSEITKEAKFIDRLENIIASNDDIYSIANVDEFVDYIKVNMRAQPEVYAQIRQVNAGILIPAEEEQTIMDVGKNECAASGN